MKITDFLKKLFPDKTEEIESFETEESNKEDKKDKKDFTNEEIAFLTEQNKALTKELKELKDLFVNEKSSRENTFKQMRQDKISSLLDEGIKLGKITPEQKEKWQKRLENNFEETKEIFAELPANPTLANEDKKNSTSRQTTKNDYLNDYTVSRELLEQEYRANSN